MFVEGQTVRIVYGGTVTSGGVVLKAGGTACKVRHHHGREEWIPKRNLRDDIGQEKYHYRGYTIIIGRKWPGQPFEAVAIYDSKLRRRVPLTQVSWEKEDVLPKIKEAIDGQIEVEKELLYRIANLIWLQKKRKSS